MYFILFTMLTVGVIVIL